MRLIQETGSTNASSETLTPTLSLRTWRGGKRMPPMVSRTLFGLTILLAGGCGQGPPAVLVQRVAAPPARVEPAAAPAAHFPRRYCTIAHDILDLESRAAPVNASMYALLDSIIDDARRRIGIPPQGGDAETQRFLAIVALLKIDDVLIRHNFIYPRLGQDVHLLSEGLTPRRLERRELEQLLAQEPNARRRGRLREDQDFHVIDCDLLCMVYLGIGQATGLPLSMVEAPHHDFLRWRFPSGDQFNWETIYALERSDLWYARSYFGSVEEFADLARRGVFFRSLSSTQVLGYSRLLCGESFAEQGKYPQAMAEFRQAMEMYPQSSAPPGHLAWLLITCPEKSLRQPDQAVVLARQAQRLWPCAATLDRLACALAEAHQFQVAADTEQRACNLDPNPDYGDRRAAFARQRTYWQYLENKAAKVKG